MLTGIIDVLIIPPRAIPLRSGSVGDGSQWGMRFAYETQSEHGARRRFQNRRDFLDGNQAVLSSVTISLRTRPRNNLESASRKPRGRRSCLSGRQPRSVRVVDFDQTARGFD